MNEDTYMLEVRLVGTALDTGELADLEPGHFQVEAFSLLWAMMRQYAEVRGEFDHVVLGEYLYQHKGIDKREWLRTLAAESIPKPELIGKYAESLRAYSERHALGETFQELAERSRRSEANEIRDEALERLRSMVLHTRSEVVHVRQAMQASIQAIEERFASERNPGVKTGIARLDEKLGGWQKGDLALLAARPAVGKTALMCNMALAARCRVGIVSTEQPAEQIVNRLAAIAGGLPAWKFRAPKAFTNEEWPKLTEAVSRIAELDITIMDNTRPSVGEIERAFREAPPEILFVDYAQRLKASGEIYERISSIAHALKDLARNYDIPVVSLAQINRQGSKNAGMEHLKGSGDLEQEADEVLILERGESENTAVLTLEKNRHGPTGSIDLIFNAPCLTFREAVYR